MYSRERERERERERNKIEMVMKLTPDNLKITSLNTLATLALITFAVKHL